KTCRNLLPPLWGRAGERAFSEWWQSFLIPSPPKYKPCGLLPSLQPSPTGREDYEARRQARGLGRHCCCGFGRGFIRRQF
ncbi:hypothetical protein IH337_001944, partial [Neisseria gonorrhoeae]